MTIVVFLTSLLGAMALGMPIAFALIVCALALMLWLGNFDSQIVAQNMIIGADNFQLLAVPFFLLAGELMNVGGLVEAHRQFRAGVPGAYSRRPGLCGHRCRAHPRGPVRFRSRGYGRSRRHPDPDDAQCRLRHSAGGGTHRGRRHHRSGHPAFHRLHRLRRRGECLDLPAVPGRRRARHNDGHFAGGCVGHRHPEGQDEDGAARDHARARQGLRRWISMLCSCRS